jgi:hypothetical protein
VSPVKHELGFYIPEGAILHSHRRENLKSYIVINCLHDPWTWTVSLDKRPKRWDMEMRCGTWNIGRLYRAGSLMTVSARQKELDSDLQKVQDVR